jgi:hypothetical protein
LLPISLGVALFFATAEEPETVAKSLLKAMNFSRFER